MRLAISMYDDQRRARLNIATAPDFAVTYHHLSGAENSTGQDLAWSPDARDIAYIDATTPLPEVSALWVHRLGEHDGGQITDGKTLARSPQFSRDGRSLTYISNRGGSSDLWLQNLTSDGRAQGEPTRLTTGVGMSSGTFSPDGKLFAYSRGREELANLWRIPLDNNRVMTWADATQLTFDDALIGFADVSMDGSTLYFSSDRRGNQDIWRMPANGGEVSQVTFDSTPDWRPSLSPDARDLVFYSYRTGRRELWRMPVAGGAATQLTFRGGTYHPAWSSAGMIAFSSIQEGVRRLFIIPEAGGESRAIGEPGDNLPAWSPDGQRVAFSRGLTSGNLTVIADSNGVELTRFADHRQGTRVIWSRDGQFLLQPDGTQIRAFNIKERRGRVLANLAGRPGSVGQFSLASDGRFVYFTWLTPMADIWLMDVTTSQSRATAAAPTARRARP